MTSRMTGACLCGAVTFEIDGDFDSFFLCHCTRCQKGTGTAHAANLFSSSASLAWLSGEEQIKSFQLPETRHRRDFCTGCGSPVPSLQMKGALLVVPAGSLEGEVSIRPDSHICVSDSSSWSLDPENIPKIQGLPGAD